MSELIINQKERFQNLYDFTFRLISGDNGKMLIEQYKPYIETVTASETMHLFDALLQNNLAFDTVKNNAGKIINVFYKSLNESKWEKPQQSHFISYLMQENREVEKVIDEFRPDIKIILKKEENNYHRSIQRMRTFISMIKKYELHYIKKENILFPYIEKTFPQYRCLQLMWSFHDDFRKSVRTLETLLIEDKPDSEKLNKELGRLFFVIFPIIFREEKIVFPLALHVIPQQNWDEMLQQSYDSEWCYGINPTIIKNDKTMEKTIEGKINLGSGFLLPEQLLLMLNHLPVDITFVDEFDQVCYFSGSTHRIFPRSNAIIGRKVQNCHPHESVHVVNEIIEAFRSGIKDHADFWIRMRERDIHIRYFAMRDEQGKYKGTIEVSQDITEIKQLKGERRLLDWTEK